MKKEREMKYEERKKNTARLTPVRVSTPILEHLFCAVKGQISGSEGSVFRNNEEQKKGKMEGRGERGKRDK